MGVKENAPFRNVNANRKFLEMLGARIGGPHPQHARHLRPGADSFFGMHRDASSDAAPRRKVRGFPPRDPSLRHRAASKMSLESSPPQRSSQSLSRYRGCP